MVEEYYGGTSDVVYCELVSRICRTKVNTKVLFGWIFIKSESIDLAIGYTHVLFSFRLACVYSNPSTTIEVETWGLVEWIFTKNVTFIYCGMVWE